VPLDRGDREVRFFADIRWLHCQAPIRTRRERPGLASRLRWAILRRGTVRSDAVKVTLSRERHRAVVFDLDGVLADSARLHAAAWKEAFDAFLTTHHPDQAPFEAADYLAHVDGRPRRDGVRAFLASRGIVLPEGGADDPRGAASVEGVAADKQARVVERLARESRPLPGAERLMAALRAAGVRVAVATSSANGAAVLRATGLERFVEVRVDGIEARRLGLPGKPDPAAFEEALRRLGVPAREAVVFEDALSGVEAGRAASFALVVGVGAPERAQALRASGADVVVADLGEVALD
jgi:beta-phosphoglucomutase family hydrolase